MPDALRQDQFLTVIDRDEAERRFRAALDLSPLAAELVPLADALGRVLAADVAAPLDVPGFDRANVDGFALRAEDTFGASEDRPRELTLNAEQLAPGRFADIEVSPGTATAVATGAALPRGVDAVVMIEHTDIGKEEGGRMKDEAGKASAGSSFILHPSAFLLLSRPATPGANVTFAGTDIGRDEVVLRRGDKLTARETGVLAALGLANVSVVRRPRVAVLSTGAELAEPGTPLAPGCIYDSNATVLADAIRELGGVPVRLGIVPDDLERLREALRLALEADAVLLSGGTSKGAGDVSYRAVGEVAEVLAHGVALKPGKPLCLAVARPAGRRAVPVAVLPGFPTSAAFTFHEFLAPVLRRLAGLPEEPPAVVTATLPVRVNSERGRTEYLLVNLVGRPGGPVAVPLGKGSGSVTAFARADGFVTIPRQTEYLEAGALVEVRAIAGVPKPADLVVIGSHCIGLDLLLGLLRERGFSSKFIAVGSQGGLDAVQRGECDVAGVHLYDPLTGRYNEPFLTPDLLLLPGYGRLQGLIFRPGDDRFADDSFRHDPACRLVNRNRGSGTRALIDELLRGAKPPGYLTEAKSHNAACAAVAQGRADWGVAIAPVAAAAGLAFRPLRPERFDFIVPAERRDAAVVRAFAEVLAAATTRVRLAALGFADVETEKTGSG